MHRILFFLFLLTTSLGTFAMPAQPGTKRITLPDGTTRDVLIRGDERCHWLCDTQGREILGSRIVSNRLIEPTSTPYTTPRKAPGKAGDMLLEGSFPTIGKRRLLALLINFANTTPTFSREQFDAMLNEEGYNGVGSFRDYYLDQSLGQLDIQTTVTPWITVSQPKQFYNIDNTPALIEEALKQIDANIDLHDYDNDGDGILDGLIVIHAGEGQEASGNATDIWSHSSTIYGMQFDGVSIYRYTIEPEVLHGAPSTIGVFCHEFGHNLGALDYYDTNYSSDGAYGGTGPWDLMGEGAWNGSAGQGTHPAPFTAWQRWQFGWITPEVLCESRRIEALQAGASEGKSYRMDTTTEGDYFILENIQNVTPWTSDLPGHGLIVTHVIESIVRRRMAMNNINASYPQGIYTVCADAHGDPKEGQPSSYGDLTSSATPFPGTRNHTDFSDETLPSTHSQDGRYGYIALQSIVEVDGLVSFDFIQGDAPQRPLDLIATVVQGSVRLTWSFPAEREHPVHCKVYREGTLLATIKADADGRFAFNDSDAEISGLVTYSIDATYASGLTSATTSISTRIPPQIATDLQGNYDADAERFVFSWTTPAELTRCINDLHYELVDHYATTARYAHRFRADDLRPFVGREVRSITFLPQQRSTDASYYISVWRMPTPVNEPCPTTIAPNTLELVAQRKVAEFSPSYLRTTPFVTRPKIEPGYDYLIGVEMDTNGLAEIVTDQSELQSGFGNMISLNGGVWQADQKAKGNYILAATLAGSVPEENVSVLIVDRNSDALSTLFDIFATPFAPDADLHFPLGFTLYANGQRVAETTGSSLQLPIVAAPIGVEQSISFQLVSAYKQGNESRPLSIEVPYEIPAGLHPATANDATGTALFDLAGRRILPSAAHHGIFLQGQRKIVR